MKKLTIFICITGLQAGDAQPQPQKPTVFTRCCSAAVRALTQVNERYFQPEKRWRREIAQQVEDVELDAFLEAEQEVAEKISGYQPVADREQMRLKIQSLTEEFNIKLHEYIRGKNQETSKVFEPFFESMDLGYRPLFFYEDRDSSSANINGTIVFDKNTFKLSNEQFANEQFVYVLLHELAHLKYKHMFKSFLLIDIQLLHPQFNKYQIIDRGVVSKPYNSTNKTIVQAFYQLSQAAVRDFSLKKQLVRFFEKEHGGRKFFVHCRLTEHQADIEAALVGGRKALEGGINHNQQAVLEEMQERLHFCYLYHPAPQERVDYLTALRDDLDRAEKNKNVVTRFAAIYRNALDIA